MIRNVEPQLSQWDVGRSVSISDSNATHMHFANQGDYKAVIIEIKDGSAKIPDFLLQTGKPVVAYAVFNGVTLESRSFPVRKREKPESYDYEEDQRNYIYKLIVDAEMAVVKANKAADSAYLATKKVDQFLGDCVTPQMFGAVADGAHDVTEAVRTAFATHKKVYFPEGIYLINGEINIKTDYDINVIGDGPNKTVIWYRYTGSEDDKSGGRMVFNREKENGDKAVPWRPGCVRIEGIYFEVTSGIDIYYAQFGIIKDCVFECTGDNADATAIGINLLDECHYFTIEDTKVGAFNTGIRMNASNGCIIKSNYINACATPILVESDYNKICDTDIEGHNGTMRITGHWNTIDNLHLERNNQGAWVEVAGNANILNVEGNSDGASYYQPLLNITGKRNVCTVKGGGYRIVDNLDASNKVRVLENFALMNGVVISKAAMKYTDIEFPNNTVIYDSAVDGLEKLFEVTGGYIDGNMIVADADLCAVTMNIEGILQGAGVASCYALFKTTQQAGEFSFYYGVANPISTVEWGTGSDMWYLCNNMVANPVKGAAVIFDRIILTDSGTMEQINCSKEWSGGVSRPAMPTAADEGKFLRVVNGKATWTALPVYNGEVL